MNEVLIHVSWEAMKAISTESGRPIRGEPVDGSRYAFLSAPGVVYRAFIRSDLTDSVAEFDSLVDNAAEFPDPVAPKLDGDVSSMFETSHNFGDKTSWWFNSGKAVDETLQGSGTSWQASNTHVIDLEHGKYLFEDDIAEAEDSLASITPQAFTRDPRVEAKWGADHFLIPVLKDYEGNELTRVDGSPGPGEWSIDYETGAITTGDDWGANAPVFSYHYATDSVYEFWVHPGKDLYVDRAEVQVYDADINSAKMYYDIVMDHPQHGTITYKRRAYKSIEDVMAACVGAPGTWVDSLGREWEVFPWPYSGPKAQNEDARIHLQSALAMKVRLSLKDDKPYEPTAGNTKPYVTVSLYGISKGV